VLQCMMLCVLHTTVDVQHSVNDHLGGEKGDMKGLGNECMINIVD